MQCIKRIVKQPSCFYGLLTVLYILVTILSVQWLFYKGDLALKMAIDAPFHFARIKGLAEIWQGPISFNSFLHYGSPINIFYPWLTLYPMFIFYQITHNLIDSYWLYFSLLTFATLWLCYYVTIKMTNRRSVAVLFSLAYCLSLYRQANILYRHAVGEAIAMSVFPLILYGVYKVFYAEKKSFIPLTIGMTLLAYTHLISLAMASGFVFIVFLFAIMQKRVVKQTFGLLVKATLVSLVLSVGSLIPIIYYRTYTTVQDPEVRILNIQAMKPVDLLLTSLNNQLGMRQYSIGLVILLFIYFIWRSWQKLKVFEQTIFWLGLISLILCTTLTPWSYLQESLTLLQFPWRFLSFAVLCLAYTGSYAFILSIQKNYLYSVLIMIVTILFLQISLIAAFMPATENSKLVFTNKRYQHIIATSFSGKTDYIGKRAVKHFKRYKNQQVYLERIALKTKANYQVKEAEYIVKNPKTAFLDLPVLASPGLKVNVNNKQVEWDKNKYDGLRIKAPAGKVKIQVKSTYPKVMIISYWLSLISLIIIILILFYKYIKNKKTKIYIKN